MRSAFEREIRFLVNPAWARDRLSELSPMLVPDVHDPERPCTWNRTTYLDTEDLVYFHGSDGTVVQRLRVREYGTAIDPGARPDFLEPCALELKITRGAKRHKLRWWAPGKKLQAAIAGDRTALVGCPTLLRRHLSRGLSPRVVTCYRRLALKSPVLPVRLTLDLDLHFTHPDGQEIARADLAVMEAKLRGDPPGWLTELLTDLGSPKTFSKFRAGMLLLGGSTCALSSSSFSSQVVPPSPTTGPLRLAR